MKRIVIYCATMLVALSVTLSLTAQSASKQALRVGAGANINAAIAQKQWYYGPTFSLDYQYTLSKYFDANLNFSYLKSYDYFGTIYSYSPALRVMATPLANPYFQIGLGVRYYINDYKSEIVINNSFFGVDIPIRFYLINSNRFQLFIDYVGAIHPKFGADSKALHYNAHLFSLYFGVKF